MTRDMAKNIIEERKTVGYKKSTCNICMNMVNSECCENEMVLCYEVY